MEPFLKERFHASKELKKGIFNLVLFFEVGLNSIGTQLLSDYGGVKSKPLTLIIFDK